MPSSASFTGSPLFLLSVTQVASNTVRVKFSQDPLASNAAGTNDALNIANYLVTGPASVTVSSVTAIATDPQSFNINLNVPLIAGVWTLTVINIQTALGNALTSPTSLTFTGSLFSQAAPLSGGAINDSAAAFIRRLISPNLSGPGWDAIIAAIATGDEYVRTLARNAYDQLFVSTAEGKYLDRLLSDDGLTRPVGIGISDDVYRNLGIKVNSHKLTLESFLEVLEVFYGADALRATIDSSNETYNIQEGDDLVVEVEGSSITIIFHQTDFAVLGRASAIEVASAITRGLRLGGVLAYAAPILDVLNNISFVRIYSGALGLRGALRVLGGKAQNILKFKTLLSTTQTIGTQWRIDTPATITGLIADRARFTFIGGTDPSLSLVQIGDYINVYGSPFSAVNRGHFLVTAVTTTYFEIENVLAVAQATVTQTAINDILFFRPTKFTINSKSRISTAIQASANNVDVILAATTQAVSRGVNTAAYLHGNSSVNLKNFINCVSVVRNTNVVAVQTTTPHGFLVGDTFYLAPGDPNNDQFFYNQVYTVAGVSDSTHFTYNQVATNATAALPQYIYPCYRDSSGLVTAVTTSNHGFSTNDFIQIDNLIPSNNTAAPLHFKETFSGLPGTGYLDWAGAGLLQDGKILVCGGTDGTNRAFTNIYNPTTNTWSAASNMGTARSKHTATVLNNGRVLVTGGNAGIATCETYDSTLDTWVPTLSMSNARFAHTATLLKNGKVLVVGGGSATAEIFDPVSETWASTNPPAVDRKHAQAVLLNNGSVLVCGGYTVLGTGLTSAELYNPNNNTWTTLPSMATARYYHQAVNIPNIGVDGKVLITGGTDNGTHAWNSAELFEPMTRTWSAAASFTTGRNQHSMVIMSDGNVLIHGGLNGASAAIDEASIYYPLLDAWSNNIANGNRTRATHRSILLNDKRVLSTQCNTGQQKPELFVPQTSAASAGGLTGLYKITVINATKFTYNTTNTNDFNAVTGCVTSYTDNFGNSLTATATSEKAVNDPNHIGPYIFDPTQGPAITGINTTTTQDIVAGQTYSTLNVANAANFPVDGGYLALGFGTSLQIFPIRYVFRATSTSLLLNSAIIFPFNIASGTSVILLSGKGAFAPDDPTQVGAFYLTDSISGRISASSIIDSIAAAGIILNKYVKFPGTIGLAHGDINPLITGPQINDALWVWGSESEIVKIRGY
jgi:hypothetical protein